MLNSDYSLHFCVEGICKISTLLDLHKSNNHETALVCNILKKECLVHSLDGTGKLNENFTIEVSNKALIIVYDWL